MTKRFYITITLFMMVSVFPLIPFPHAQGKDDRQQIIAHLHSIFAAFVRQDRETIRATHTKDWTGFQAHSREIVRGLDGYMKHITPENSQMLEYEIQDIEVKIYGDTAVVYYVAQWKNRIKATGQIVTMRARSVDIYRKEAGHWNQAGSNLNILPTPGFRTTPGCEKCYDVSIAAGSE